MGVINAAHDARVKAALREAGVEPLRDWDAGL